MTRLAEHPERARGQKQHDAEDENHPRDLFHALEDARNSEMVLWRSLDQEQNYPHWLLPEVPGCDCLASVFCAMAPLPLRFTKMPSVARAAAQPRRRNGWSMLARCDCVGREMDFGFVTSLI